jgi:GGDEF domain-containing protein
MSTMGSLASAVRRHPWASAFDASLVTVAMLVGIILALEYDIISFWDDLTDRQRRLRVEEIALLTVLLAGGLGVFIARRVREARRDFERELRSEAEAHAARTLAMQDPLTELPNRRKLAAALEAATGRPPKNGGMHAFYLLDLNGFKSVNDEHGHAAGDEFAVLACDIDSRAKAHQIGERFVSALGDEIVVAGRSHPIGVAIGVALYPEDGRTAEEVMHHADLAMYKAKAEKRSSLHFFEAA